MDGVLHLASSGDKGFFDAAFLYIAGGALVVMALAVAFLGMRNKDFPSSRRQLRAVAGLTVVLVACTAVGAVLSARYEQAERRAENEEAAKEAGAEEEAKQAEEAPLTEGEAAQPGTATGEASSPQESAGADGKALFVDSGCGDCHVLADADTSGQVGPVLDDVLPDMSADMIRTSIVDPGAEVSQGFPDGVMPAVYGDQFTEAELDALVAYLGDVAGKK
jgi:mono/diheme cytochrome c family protein